MQPIVNAGERAQLRAAGSRKLWRLLGWIVGAFGDAVFRWWTGTPHPH
jgi:hypothetical protein